MEYMSSRRLVLTLVGGLALIVSLAFSGNANAGSFTAKPLPPAVPTCPGGCGGDSFYGANQGMMSTAFNKGDWPQQHGNWCGVANIELINWYDQIKTFGNNVFPTWQTQQEIANLLNTSSATSPWGQATCKDSTHPAFVADIAADGGTDPRSISWGLWTVTPNGFYFHNWVYDTSNVTATYDFASDFGPAHGLNDPISVTIDVGKHSFVVDGVYATSDPSAGGEVVDGIDTWDPAVASGFGQYNSTIQEVWSTSDWWNKQYSSGSVLWKNPYNTNNSFGDPEPSTTSNNYYNAPPLGVHWNNQYVTIEQDLVTRCNASPDIAYNQNGAEVPHNGSAYCP